MKCQDGGAEDPEFLIKNNVLIKFMRPNQKEAVIPDGITEIGESAFQGFKNLETVEIPECVKKIGRFAFDGCSNLKKINLLKYLWLLDALSNGDT